LYDPLASSTSNLVGKTFNIQHGSGAISGGQYMDNVALAGYTVGSWHLFSDG
jgi:hypothetical protein